MSWLSRDLRRSRVTSSVVSLLVLCVVVLGALFVPAGADSDPDPAAVEGASSLGRELPAMRTRTSRTYVGQDGGRVSRLFTQSVNFKDSAGNWRKIDNGLESTADGYANRENRYRVELPKDLAEPVRVSKDGAWVEYALEGAASAGTADRATARYRGALAGVDVSYTAASDAVKESFSLAGPESKRVFRFALKASAGLSARKGDEGAIEIVDGAGATRFSFAPPVMWDSSKGRAVSRQVAVDLTRQGDGYVVELAPNKAWLADRRRVWPVVVDPTVMFGPQQDCTIKVNLTYSGSGEEYASYCGDPDLRVGQLGEQRCSDDGGCETVTFNHRSLLKFDLGSAIPSDALVQQAKLGLYANYGTPFSAAVHGLTRAFTSAVSWRRYDAVNSWTTPGGDFEAAAAASGLSGSVPGWSYWYPTSLVSRWVSGQTANSGLVVKASSEPPYEGGPGVSFRSSESFDAGTKPYLEVSWHPRTGDYPNATFDGQQLTDRSSLGVNVANGNLLVSNTDLQIAGTGLDLLVDRHYNGLSAATGSLGKAWNLGTGQDVELYDGGDRVTLRGQTGELLTFTRDGNGAYASPPGVHATLTFVDPPPPPGPCEDGGCPPEDPSYFKLTDHATGGELRFTSSGTGSLERLTAQRDRYGNTISFAYSAGKLSSITDTQGRVIAAQQDAAGRLKQLTDPTGRSIQYAYNAQGSLETYTDAAGKETGYGYDAQGRLSSITTPGGRVTRISYDSEGRVETVVRTTDAAHTTGPTTRFAYSTGSPCAAGESKVVVSDPLAGSAAGHTVTYCGDGRNRVTKTVDSAGNTATKSYGPTGDLVSLKQPGGGVTNFGWDATTRKLLCVQRGATSVQACQTGSGGLKTTFAYANTDALTKYFPTRITNPQNRSVVICYNGSAPACGTQSGPAGSVQSLTNGLAAQSVRRFAYNAKGNPTSSTDARGYVTSYGYDLPGNNLTSVTPPGGAGLGARGISPDALGRPHVVTDGKGQTATYSYDPLDRVTGTAYAPGGPTFGATYDDDGAQRTLTDPGGTTSYTTDDLLRLTREGFPDGTSNAYDYDAASNRTTITDPGGATTYAYNGLNQPSSVTEPGDSTATTFTYNSDGARTQIRYPSGVTVNTGYDVPSGRVTSVSNKAPNGSTVLRSFAYNYTLGTADTELPQKVTDQANNVTTNSYDALDRLTSAVTTGPSPSRFAYVLDGNGNRLSITYNRSGSTGGTTETYAYDSASLPCWRALGALPSACGSPPPSNVVYYTHDANGSDLWNTRQQYTYNTAGQPTSVYVSATARIASLAYRGDGQAQLTRDGSYTVQTNQLGIGVRASGSTAAASSTSSTTSSSSTAAADDERSASPGRLAAKPPPPSSTSPCESSTSSTFSPLAAAATATSYYARATDGTALSQRTPSTSQRRNYLYDGEGTVVGLTDTSGTLQTSYKYEPYGHPANFTSLGDPNPFGYHGAYTAGIENAGVICGGPNASEAAFYDAEDGRFTQVMRPLSFVKGAAGAILPRVPLFSVGVDVEIELGPVRLSGGVSIDSHGNVGVSGGAGGGAGLGGGIKAMINPFRGVENGGEIEGGGCVGPGPAACYSTSSSGSASVGVGVGAEAGIAYRQTRRIFSW